MKSNNIYQKLFQGIILSSERKFDWNLVVNNNEPY